MKKIIVIRQQLYESYIYIEFTLNVRSSYVETGKNKIVDVRHRAKRYVM